MKRSHVGLVRTVVKGSIAASTIAALIHCGGGTNPPAADSDFVDSGSKSSSSGSSSNGGVVSFPDIDVTQGVVFGDSGFTDCGKQAAAKTVTLRNSSSNLVNYTASIVNGSDYYTIDKQSGGILPNSVASLTLTPKPIPATSDVTTDLYGGTLELDFPGNGLPQQIKLHQTARGSIVNISGGAAGSNGASFAFGDVQVGTSKPISVSFSNAGNQDVNATLTLGSNVVTIDGAQTSSADLQPNTPVSKPLAFAPTSAGNITDTLTISYPTSAVFCKPPTTSATITGNGTTSVGVTPGTLDFGQVNCGSTAPSQTLSISSTIAMSFTAVLTKGGQSAYTMADSNGNPVPNGDSIQLAAASTYALKVVPKKIDQVSPTTDNAFGDTLTITTSVPGDSPHVVNLLETAKGAILKFDQSSITVSGPVNTNINTTYNLVNSGNQQIPYAIRVLPAGTGPGQFSTNLSTDPSIGNAGNAIVGNTPGVLISHTPVSSGSTVTGSLGVVVGAAGGVLCADLPPAVPLSVTGTGSAITINPTNLNFGLIDCNDPVTQKTADKQVIAAPQSITISSTVATNIKLSLGLGPASPYTLAQDSANTMPIALNSSVAVAANGSYVLWLIPKVIFSPASTASNAFGDTLTLTSDIAAEAVRTVALSETAHGIIYAFPANIQAQKNSATTFTIANNGNATAQYSLGGDTSQITPNTGFRLGGGASASYAVNAGSTGGKINLIPDASVDQNGKPLYPICSNPGSISIQAAQ